MLVNVECVLCKTVGDAGWGVRQCLISKQHTGYLYRKNLPLYMILSNGNAGYESQ